MGGRSSGAMARVCLTAVALVGMVGAAPAGAQIYWANEGADSVGRADLDGTSVDQGFVTGATAPRGVAIDSGHVYWAHGGAPGSIGRAEIDGGNPNQAFIGTTGSPQAVAVDSTRVYWSQTVDSAGRIGRALLNGSGANQSFIPTASPPCGVMGSVDDVYWANTGDPGSIGTAHFNGADPDQSLVGGQAGPCGVAVADGHLYWANEVGGSIGRANLDGTEVNADFATAPGACGVAVDGDHIYWTSPTADTVGRADIDGVNEDADFITGAQDPCGIAVSPSVEMTPASNDFGATAVGHQSEILSLFAGNTSSSVLDVTGVTLLGADSGDFEITGDGCTVNVAAPLGGCVLNVRFSPTAVGVRTATLRIVSNASNSPADVLLSGEGIPDTEAPSFLSASVRPSTFSVAPASASKRAHRGTPEGTAFRYVLSEDARVAFKIRKRVEGSYVPVGRFTQEGVAGKNKRSFSGQIGGASLGPGSYRAKLGARDAAGNRAEPVFRRFWIVP